MAAEPNTAPRRIQRQGHDGPLARLILDGKPMPEALIRASEDRGDEIVITVKIKRQNFRELAFLDVEDMCPPPESPVYAENVREMATEWQVSEEVARTRIAGARATFLAAEEVAWNRFKASGVEDEVAKFIHERMIYSSNFDTLFAEITASSASGARRLRREAERILDEYEASKPRRAITEIRGGKPPKWTKEAKRAFQKAAAPVYRLFRDLAELDADDEYGIRETLAQFPAEQRSLAEELQNDRSLSPTQRTCKYVATVTATPTASLSTLEKIFHARRS